MNDRPPWFDSTTPRPLPPLIDFEGVQVHGYSVWHNGALFLGDVWKFGEGGCLLSRLCFEGCNQEEAERILREEFRADLCTRRKLEKHT